MATEHQPWQKVALKNFKDQIDSRKHEFSSGDPFPHIYLDNVFPESFVTCLLSEFPHEDDAIWDRSFIEDIQVKLRTNWKSELDMTDSARELIHFLNSGEFLKAVSELTGIERLISDPYLTGGGLNCILPGGLLDVHADGNWHDDMGVHRRLNAILYLNRNWMSEWGGQFELWDRELKGCKTKIEPLANRLMIFETHDFSYHGHPHPLQCPEGNSRKSAIVYYYTSEPRPQDQILRSEPHRALWRRRDLNQLDQKSQK
jgi:Rps23 Pro-64 3,4-dihydroxylase Tpa1-like proline 4-hydroxylase